MPTEDPPQGAACPATDGAIAESALQRHAVVVWTALYALFPRNPEERAAKEMLEYAMQVETSSASGSARLPPLALSTDLPMSDIKAVASGCLERLGLVCGPAIALAIRTALLQALHRLG